MGDRAQLTLELTRKKIEENRNLLLEKNAELTEISCRLEDVQKQIKHLKSYNTDDVQLESMRHTDSLRIQLQNEQIKFDFFKQVNILNQNFSLSGRKYSNKPIDNLVRCLIDISDRTKLPKAYLYENSTYMYTDETIDQFIAELKKFVYIEENSNEITQAKLNEMCNKISELKQSQMPSCILFDQKNKSLMINTKIDEEKIFLYQHGDNFLVLQAAITENMSVVDKVHETVNNLICDQVLYEMCFIKLKEKCGSTVDECSMEMLFQALQKFKKDFIENKDQVQKRFLNEINVTKNENVIESIIQSQVTLLIELLNQVDEYTVEYESVKQDIDLLREKFVERIEIFLFDECEKRKKMAQAKLKMDINEGDLLENEIRAKQNEINKLNNLLSKKNDQLDMKSKEIELKREQLKLLVDSHGKQEKEINDQMERLKQELAEKQEEMKIFDANQNDESERVDELRTEIQSKQTKMDELNSKKKILEKKRDELSSLIEAEIKEKASLQKEKIECQETKKYLEEQLNELNNESFKLEKLIQFVQAIYNQLLTNQSLFSKRADLNTVLHSNMSFLELYTYLVNQNELTQFKDPIVERLAKENVYKRRELLVNCLDKILAEPVLTSYRDKNGHLFIELCSINVNFDQIEPLINRHIEKEIENTEIFTLDSTKRFVCIKDDKLKMTNLLENKNSQVSVELMNLIHKRMRKKFLIKNRDNLNAKNGHLTSKTKIKLSVKEKKFETLGELNAKSVCQLLDLDFQSIRKCFSQTIKIIAGHNVFIEKKELRESGVNLAIVAGADVVLPIGAIIDTSGSAEAVSFEYDQAHGYAHTSNREDKCCEGESGVDGYDGFCGENAGHIYIKAANLIQNLDRIAEIRINGGKGGQGQMGGSGQGGGPGQDTGDAEAENLSPCLFSPGFVVAFARMPGLDPETGEFSRNGELSGKGGDAGKTGLGGMGGHAGEFLIKDSKSWIANKQENKELIESSDNLKSLIKRLMDDKKIVCSQGTAGPNGNYQSVKGGKAGKAGTYGRDHVIYVDGLFSSRQDLKGDYSNYLLEKPLVETGTLDFDESKYAAKSIIDDPDAYATRSKSYTVFSGALTVAAVVGAGFLLAPIITAAIAVVPVIGLAAWATGLVIAGTGVLSVIAGLAGAAMVFSTKTLSGLDYKIGVKKEMKMKNRQQIMFNNRYCCVPPLRDGVSCSENLRRGDKRSEKEDGMDSCLREESEREEPSKANETANEFADAYERAVMGDKANSLRTDSTKEEAIKLANEELKQLAAQIEQCQNSMETIVEQMNQLNQRLNQCELNINEHQKQVTQLDQQMNSINDMLANEQSEMSQVHRQMLQSVDLYLNSVDKQVSTRIQLQLSLVNLNSKVELAKNLNQVFASLKQELGAEAQQLIDEKMNLQNDIEMILKQKEQSEQEIEAFRDKELNAIKSQMNTEKEVAELEELRKKLKNEQQTNTENNATDEIMVMKDFKRDNKSTLGNDQANNLNLDFSQINFFKRKIDLKLYASIFSTKDFPKFHDLVTQITQKTKKERNSVIGKIEFLIHAYSTGFYQRLLDENKNTSKMEKLINLLNKDPTKEFESSKLFDEIKKNPYSLDILYEKVATHYFKNTSEHLKYQNFDLKHCEIYLQHVSLNDHYELSKNDCLTKLEQDLAVFVQRICKQKINKENLLRVIKLVKDYMQQIEQIGMFKVTALAVIEYRINYFYDSIITYINNSLDSCECEFIWPLLDDLFNLIELLRLQFDKINTTNLWSGWNLMKNQIYLLGNFVQQIEYVKAKKKEIDNWTENEQNELGIFKIQLIVECLKPKLIEVLVSKCDRREFDTLKSDLIKTSICTSQEKDEYLVKCKLKHSIAKNNCVSKQGFMTKYRLLLSMSQQDMFDFNNIAEHAENIYINSEKLEETVSIMLKEYEYLLNEDKSLTFEQIISVYLKLACLKNPSLLMRKSIVSVFDQIEMNLSEKIEEKILNSLGSSKFAHSEIQDQFNAVLNQRIKDIDGKNVEIMLRKAAFYEQMFKLVNSGKENDKIKKVSIMLTYCNGSLGAGECQQLDSSSKELVKKFKCDANDERNAFEHIIFKLSEYQYEIVIISMKLNDQTIDQNEQKDLQTKLKDLVSQFKKICKDITNVKSNSQMFKALKIYVNKLEENQLNEERRKKLSKFCSIGKESDFLKELIKLFNDVEISNLKKLVEDVLKSNLSDQFVANSFLLGLVVFYKSIRKTNNDDFVFKLIDLIDIEQSLNQNKYDELLDYLDKLRIIPKKYTIKLIERIEHKLKCLTNDLIGLSYKLSNSNSLIDKNVLSVLNVLAELSESIGLVTKENVNYISSMYKIINNYKIQLSELMNVRSIDQIIIDKLRDQFIDSIDSVFIDYFKNKNSQLANETNFEKILHTIKESSDDQSLSQFIHYLNIRLNLKIETSQVKALDRILIETELINWPRNNLNSFMIEQALQMLTKSYMMDLMQKTHSIQMKIELKQQELNTLLDKLIDIYKSKLDSENRLIVKARVNFLLELIQKFKVKSIQNLEEILNEYVNQAESKESASDIEFYLIEKVNSIGFESLDNEQRQTFGLGQQATIDNLFEAIFGSAELSHFRNLIELTRAKKIDSTNSLIIKIKQITSIIENFYFVHYQSEIDQLNKTWINSINKYIYSDTNQHKELIEHKTRMHYLIRAKCYRVNNYWAFVDRAKFSIKLVNLSQEIDFVLDKCQILFDDICMSKINKISSYFQLINSKLEQIELDLFTLDESQLKTNLNDLMCFELDQELKDICSRRELVLEQISRNVDQFTNEQVKLLDRKSISQFNVKFEQDFNRILSNCDQNELINKKLRSVYNHVLSEKKQQTFKAYLYLNYRIALNYINSSELTIDYLNKIGQFVLTDWYLVSIKSDSINLLLSTQNFSSLDLSDFRKKINYFHIYLTSDVNEINLIRFCEYLCSNIEQTYSIDCLYLLIKWIIDGSVYEKTTNILVHRIADKLCELIFDQELDRSYSKNIIEFLANINKIDHKCSKVVENFYKKFGIDFFKKYCLSQIEEKLFSSITNSTDYFTVLCKNDITIWQHVLFDHFISLFCQSGVETQKKSILKNNQNLIESLNLLIDAASSEKCQELYLNLKMKLIDSKNDLLDLELIKKFKDSVLNCASLMTNYELVEFFDAVKNKLDTKAIDLNVCIEILNCSLMIGEGVGELTAAINSQSACLYKRVLILTIGHLLVKLFNIEEKEKKANSIMARLYKQMPNGSERLLSIIALKLNSNLKVGLRYESSEVNTLNNSLSLLFKVVFYQPKCIDRLNVLPILKWSSILRVEQIKYELNTNDSQIVADLRTIEKLRGIEITQRFVQIVKSVKIEDLLLKFILTKFRKNEWDLNDKVLNLLENNKDTSEWIDVVKKFDCESKSKALTRSELVDEMKRLEANGEINSYVKKLIERNESGKCIIELCLDQLDTVYKSGSSLFSKIGKKIEEYEKTEIIEWTKFYKLKKKNNLESVNCVHVLELMAVLCRSVKLVYKYDARDVQKIALLMFIDSIVFNFSGRLANISTGEGKSLITISTAIAYILIKGGNVDILTSSEILAERDALESKEMFAMFDITVANNCDSLASADENVRKQRYSNSMVVYGDIGSFQRDILLSKYFEKEIRTDLAGCLIIDEVDSMCIDNICNTLYISHQIADLSYLKNFYCLIWHAVNNQDTHKYTDENVQKVKTYIQSLMFNGYFNYPCNLEDFINRRLEVWINNAYIAKDHVEEGNHYSVLSMGKKIGEAVINDLQTGVEQLNTQWSDGLQQFIQLKHLNKLGEESLKAIFMSNYIFFTQYKGNIYGMTGTLGASIERDLLAKAYDLDFFQLPRFKKELNVKQDDVLVRNKCEWLEQISQDVDLHVCQNRLVSIDEENEAKKKLNNVNNEIKELEIKINKLKQNDKFSEDDLLALKQSLNSKKLELQDLNDTCGVELEPGRSRGGRCVLIICETKNHVHDIVKTLFFKHKHLYEYTGKVEGLTKVIGIDKRKSVQIEQMRPGDIVVATNVAGRGTDFKISRLAEKNGGLHVIVTYMPDNIRVEMQAFGRSGRKGDKGSGRLIVHDQRATNLKDSIHINIDCLKDERDLNEELRLHDIRVKMIPRVMLERDLFVRFDCLYENKIKNLLKSIKSDLRHLQIKSLHNHWAFWLDKMSSTIKNVTTTNQETLTKYALDKLEIFASEIEFKMKREVDGIQGLIDEPGELIKLAMYNIKEGNFSAAVSNCDYINKNFAPNLSPYSHYYKAIALFEPVKQSFITKTVNFIAGRSETNDYTSEQAQEGLKLLKKAAFLFELEIEKLKAQSVFLADVKSNKSLVGTPTDYFTKSNTNESTALIVHLMAARIALGLDLNLDELKQIFKHSILGEDKMKELFELALGHELIQPFLKKQRFSKKIQIKIHIDKTRKNEIYLEKIFSEKSIGKLVRSESEIVLVLDKLDTDTKLELEEKNINYSYEIYIQDRLSECMKILDLPNRFKPFKNLLIKAIVNESIESKNAQERVKMYDLFKKKLDVYCTQRNKIQEFLVTNFGQVEKISKQMFAQTNSKNLLNLIEKNQSSKELIFGSSADQFVRHLSQSKFSLTQQTPITFTQFKENIFLSNSITDEKLSHLDLSSFEKADLLRSQINSLIVKHLSDNNKKIKMNQVCQLMQNSVIHSQKLRNNLIANGLANSFFTQLGFKLVNFNNEPLIECNESIKRLFEPKINAKQKLELNCDDFLKYLQAIGIVKSQRLTLNKNVNQTSIKMIIEECIGDKVAQFVDNSIEQGAINKRQYLVFNNRDKEVEKFKSFVSQALLSCLSPLKTSKECHIDYTDLIDSFKGMNLPREVDQYKQKCKNMVFSLSKLSVPWSCRMYGVALHGCVQAKIGNFLICRQALSQCCSPKTKLSSAEQIVNDIAYVVQSNEAISSASLFLCAKMTSVLVASVIGIDSYNRQRAQVKSAQMVKRVFSHHVQHVLKQMQPSTQIDSGVWLTNTIFEHTFKSIIFYIESNQEYKKRSNSLCKNLLHSGTKSRSDIDILIKQKFDEIEVEFNDRLSMKVVHLVNQLLGPLAIQLSNTNFENIFVHEATMVEIVNIVNDIIFSVDKDLRARLVEHRTQVDSEDLLLVLNNRVLENVSVKLFNAVFSHDFNKFLNHVLKSVSRKNQDFFSEKLNELKKKSLAIDEILAQDLFKHKLDQTRVHIDKHMYEIKLLQDTIFSIEF